MKDPTLNEHESIFGARIQTPDVVAAAGPGDWAPGHRHRLLAKERLPNLEYTNASCHLHPNTTPWQAIAGPLGQSIPLGAGNFQVMKISSRQVSIMHRTEFLYPRYTNSACDQHRTTPPCEAVAGPLGTKHSTWRRKFSSDENLTMSGISNTRDKRTPYCLHGILCWRH